MKNRSTRVLVVDDAVVVRRLVADVLAAEPGIDVVGTAANGRIALEAVDRLGPDLVTLDLEMPEMDGLATLKRLRRSHPGLPVIMVSAHTERGAATTLEALALGARDYVTKPSAGEGLFTSLEHIRAQLVPKVLALASRPDRLATAPAVRVPRPGPNPAAPAQVIAIGVSTGGPNALADLLPQLPADLPVPVLIVQHMPPLFTTMLAERLDAAAALPVAEATDGAEVRPGTVWIAPGGRHMAVQRIGQTVRVVLSDGPPEYSCRPSVNRLLRSVAQTYGATALGVVLTGMGPDGLEGCERVRELGGQILVQDEASSVVWGMPGFVVRAGLAHGVVPLTDMPAAIRSRIAAPAVSSQAVG